MPDEPNDCSGSTSLRRAVQSGWSSGRQATYTQASPPGLQGLEAFRPPFHAPLSPKTACESIICKALRVVQEALINLQIDLYNL